MPRSHESRRGLWALCLLGLLSILSAQAACADEVFATSFFAPEPGEDPNLGGVLKIDLDTGAVSTFISPANVLFPTDVAVGPHDGAVYVSTQLGSVLYFDATTGAPLPSLVGGQPAGTFAVLPTAGFGDAALSLLFDSDGTLNVATAFGSIAAFNGTTGAQLADRASGLPPISGLDHGPSGEIFATTGNLAGGPGEMVSVVGGVATTIVSTGASPGLQDAANPTVVDAQGDANSDDIVDLLDLDILGANFGQAASTVAEGDFNADGVVDLLDLDILGANFGEETRILVADLFGNQIMDYALDGSDGQQLAIIPPAIPNPLPPTADPVNPSNSPSEILVTPEGTLLVSTLGLTRRPDNRGALLEFDRDGNLLNTIASSLPPLSGIAFVPSTSSITIPEPSTMTLLAVGLCPLIRRRTLR